MDISLFVGKGGVGKSISSAMYAGQCAQHAKTLVVDYDGGHSMRRVLYLPDGPMQVNKAVKTGIRSLEVAIIQPPDFKGIEAAQESRVSVEKYLQQFPGDSGLVPFHDMVTSFFGALTDIKSVGKITALMPMLLDDNTYRSVVIDVAPTEGLERFLDAGHAISRSLQNLQRLGSFEIMMIGMRWPDIAAYLKGEYVGRGNYFAPRLEKVALLLKSASYYLVTTPEPDPIDEMWNVHKIVSSYGGTIKGIVMNRFVAGRDEEFIDEIKDKAQNLPIITVPENPRLRLPGSRRRANEIFETGKVFAPFVPSQSF